MLLSSVQTGGSGLEVGCKVAFQQRPRRKAGLCSLNARFWALPAVMSTETPALPLCAVWHSTERLIWSSSRFLLLLLLVLVWACMYLCMMHFIYPYFFTDWSISSHLTGAGLRHLPNLHREAPTSLWLIRIMCLATSKQPFGTGWANMTKTLRL